MVKHTLSIITILLAILLFGSFLVSCGTSNTSSGTALDGQSLMQERCSVCHSLDRVTTAHKTADQWTITIERMISHGAQLNVQEEQTLITYLTANYN